MKIYHTQEEIEADINDGLLNIEGDVEFESSFSIEASINVTGNITAVDIDACDINARNITAVDIDAGDINARNITAVDIDAVDIDACDINAGDIDAGNITARNITAVDIDAVDIDACDINAGNITARNIKFYAVALAYVSFKCKSIIGRRENSRYFCLDKEVEIVTDEVSEDSVNEAIKTLKKAGRIKDCKVIVNI